MGSGEADVRTIRAGDFDYSRLCVAPGCRWHVFAGDRCADHGGGTDGLEWRTEATGRMTTRWVGAQYDARGQTL